eukprot:jgi/Chlat1/1991/Chrsp158S02293
MNSLDERTAARRLHCLHGHLKELSHGAFQHSELQHGDLSAEPTYAEAFLWYMDFDKVRDQLDDSRASGWQHTRSAPRIDFKSYLRSNNGPHRRWVRCICQACPPGQQAAKECSCSQGCHAPCSAKAPSSSAPIGRVPVGPATAIARPNFARPSPSDCAFANVAGTASRKPVRPAAEALLYSIPNPPVYSHPAQPSSQAKQLSSIAQNPPKFAAPNQAENVVSTKPTGPYVHDHTFSSSARQPNEQNLSLQGDWKPRVNICETQTLYTVSVELPGVRSSNIRVELTSSQLVISGFRPLDVLANDALLDVDSPSAQFKRQELPHGRFACIWPLPYDINDDAVTAEFVDGILQIYVPRQPARDFTSY